MTLWPREVQSIRRSRESSRARAKLYPAEFGITPAVITAIRRRKLFPIASQAEALAAYRASFNR